MSQILYGYDIAGASPFDALASPLFRRITRAGIVGASNGFIGGALLASLPGAHKREDFGTAHTTPEGWTFYAPKEVPHIEDLMGTIADAPGNHRVNLRLGGFLVIRPAYLEPRLVFSGGIAEDFTTHYGRIARELRDKIRNNQAPPLDSHEVLSVVQAAIASTYPATPELLDAVNRAHAFLTDDDIQPILDAVFSAPFPQPVAAG